MAHNRQIFQTDSPTRWNTFKWSARIVLFLLFLGALAIAVALFKNSNPTLPKLPTSVKFFPLANPEKAHEFKEHSKRKHRSKTPVAKQIRAGIYPDKADPHSLSVLRGNITKMNMVLPQWLFIDANTDTIVSHLEHGTFMLLDSSQAKIVPIWTNENPNGWANSSLIHIVSNPVKRKATIASLLGFLKRYGMDGLSTDFEQLDSLKPRDRYLLMAFHRELADSLHAHHYLSTQCVRPFTNDYDISELHNYNDYIFLMAYDEHNDQTLPGPVSSTKWVEDLINKYSAQIQPEKFVLCVAGLGYDWLRNETGVPHTYQEALTICKESEGKIVFDKESNNLHYTYFDDNNQEHTVWFTDAATNFDVMRTAAPYGLAGVAIWRIGSEDSRLWSFFKDNLSDDSLKVKPVDLSKLKNVPPSSVVDYMEQGEVLDILQTPQEGNIFTDYDVKQDLIADETYLKLPFPYVIRKYGQARDSTVILTFDDGPDPKFTPEILDILKKENVPASFFMVGQNMESNIPLVQRIYNEGYEIGNHTFTHPNLADVTRERAKLEMNGTRRLMEIITGHSTVMFRPPFNADAEPQDAAEIIPVEESRKENYITIGESVDPQDWDVTGALNPPINADSIFDRVVRYQKLGSVILLHDAGGNRSQTVKALPMIIHYFKEKHYHFGTIAELLGKSKEDLMPTVTNPKERLLNGASFIVADSIFFIEHFIYGLFFVGIFLSIGRMVFMGILATIQNGQVKRGKQKSTAQPLVSIIVPAYNENVNAVTTVANLLKSDYPNFEIIFVNDGSKDNTYELVRDAYLGVDKVKVFDKPNGGKASALNMGIQKATAEFVICIDADTQLKTDAISKLMESFVDEDTGAVAGNVKVGNEINMLTKWQSIEYITAQNFDRKAFEILNCITVVPGAIGAFRKEAIEDAGGFTTDTLAEDCDLTIRILRTGYKVKTNSEAIAMTEAPEKMEQFLKQRFRWSFGVMQTFYKHRDACFNPKFKGLGLIALPNVLVFQILLPMFSPLADLLMLAGLFTGNAGRIGFYYLIFQLVDLAGAIIAFSFERQNIAKLWMLIPQRFTYRWLMYYILFKALSKAMKGELQGWGVLKRTGNVTMGKN